MRIMIATVTAGAGHLQAAAALEEAWKSGRPHDVIERIDLLAYVPKIQKQLYADGYLRLVEHAPELWGMVFKKTDDPALVRKLTAFRRKFARATNRKFVAHLKEFQPDVVLCTHYLPLEIMGSLKGKRGWNHPYTVSIVTDYEAHALWMEESVDLYCVAFEETGASLAARGAPANQIAATGIPIAAKFRSGPDPRAVRKQMGLRDDLPVLLVLSGGFGMGPVGEILEELDKLSLTLQVVVVAGKNEELRRELAARNYRLPTRILGFVTNMHELMAVADLIVSKPGGLTTSEAMAMGKPLFILNPIPGQEAANSDFLLEHGAAAKVNRVQDVPHRIEQLFETKKLAQLARAAKSLGRPNAAQDVCRAVLAGMANHKAEKNN
ncbi:MAG: glycosyltransferase [Verrucomicrobiota bacterium]